MHKITIGLCGIGVVGSSVFQQLKNNHQIISQKHNINLEIYNKIGARRPKPNLDTTDYELVDIFEIAKDPEVDILVELIGDMETSKKLIICALENKKDVVTANKALIAEYGNEIMQVAKEHGGRVLFEAAVAGGVPIIKTILQSLNSNPIYSIFGIVNGTSNYILSKMHDEKSTFDTALKSAQEMGYAEADPTFDICGKDAAHKLCILASLSFNIPFDFSKIHQEGIENIELEDIEIAKDMGYRIRHLAIAKAHLDEFGKLNIMLKVHPSLIKTTNMLSEVHNEKNAVLITCENLGETLYYGAGAGGGPTASAVVSDIIYIAENSQNKFNQQLPNQIENYQYISHTQDSSSFYLRLRAKDEVGMLAQIAEIFKQNNISIEAFIQKEQHKYFVNIIIITHKVKEENFNNAIDTFKQIPEKINKIAFYRII